ncbi:MAG: SYNERG-CTERM sorting domain-containing protein [Alphaproteobacteria bacterium]|nr:SYNERG-CTERM sorting domain-containing protein [Alphaproteobacteria bacterium]
MSRISLWIALPSLLLGTSAVAADDHYLAEESVRDALSAQVTDRGFEALEAVAIQAIPGLLPADLLAIPDIDQGALGFGITLRNVRAGIDIRSIDITPRTPSGIGVGAEMLMQIGGFLSLNATESPYFLSVDALFNLCEGDGRLQPTAITINALVQMKVVTGPMGDKTFDVNVVLPANNAIVFGNFNFDGACDWLAGGSANALSDVIADAVVVPLIRPVLDDLEPTIEEALQAAVIHESFEVLGKTLYVDLEPNQTLTTPDGLELRYSSHFQAATDPCVADDDPLSSLKTPTAIPAIASNPALTQIAAYVSDDMVNQALYAAYSGGLLCIDVDDELVGSSSPIPLDASLIPILGGEGYRAILPDPPGELLIRTHPNVVPVVDYTGEQPIEIQLREFDLGFYTQIEGRMARVFNVQLDVDAGVDLNLDATTGLLGVDVGIGADDFTIRTSGDVLVPGTEASIANSFKGILDTLLSTLLDSLLGDLGFALPNFGGFGLDMIDLGPGGAQGDWLRAEAGLGPVTYGDASGGCDSSGGCGGGCDSGCSGGCANGGTNGGALLLVFVPVWLARRRRT